MVKTHKLKTVDLAALAAAVGGENLEQLRGKAGTPSWSATGYYYDHGNGQYAWEPGLVGKMFGQRAGTWSSTSEAYSTPQPGVRKMTPEAGASRDRAEMHALEYNIRWKGW